MLAIKNAVHMLLAWMESGRLADLLSARRHIPYLTRHRLAAFVIRIRLVAAAFSVLTLVWIPFDVLALSADHWPLLVACRIVAAFVFILLAIAPVKMESRTHALAMLALILAIPLSLYAVAQLLLADIPLHGLAAINRNLYQALPLVVLAGLSIFPLVTSEGLLFAAVIVAVVAGIQLGLTSITVIELFSTLWVLMLALGVYLLSCAIQLHYMMALLNRASHDPLTDALTRRSGVEILDLYFRLACDQDTPLSVLFLDADNFKSINDDYGHDAGDRALKSIAAKLHALVRQADVVIRWGGEEFVVVLTNTPMSGANLVVGRIIHGWLGVRPEGGPLTASMGLAERQADGVEDWSQLIAMADSRMYVAKATGKARCVSHDEIMEASLRQVVSPPA
ncbi:MAG: GGDEF domain-containing protein [Sulfuritalea sp.]|jgi:diguanylate cyclase (GGDEF)-like protein|nr:GGDEF domain-containing protein [Sulfuritalea sp.]MDP1980995.1 GGDEF domain-containing protein [Sulfuritalea sp.]